MATTLPTRFPCWVQAVYSWGGETKRDLGFMEGDLIECLNAGDGSWWMGRLRRDRRMVGLFPSNFVRVLGDDFRPTPPRQTSGPVAGSGNSSRSGSLSVSNPSTPTPQKNKSVFRKPFTAYAAAQSPSSTPSVSPSPANSVSKPFRPKPYSSMKAAQSTPPKSSRDSTPAPPSPPRIPNPVPRAQKSTHKLSRDQGSLSKSRPVSPLPQSKHGSVSRSREVSPYHRHTRQASRLSQSQSFSESPPRHASNGSIMPSPPASSHPRSLTPGPPDLYQHDSSTSHHYEISKLHSYEEEVESSPPPPPPPAHRVAYTRASTPLRAPAPSAQPAEDSSYDSYRAYQPEQSRASSPDLSHERSGYTPSPLRDAMNDVMNSLEVMGVSRHTSVVDRSHDEGLQSTAVWSPDTYDDLYSSPQPAARPHTLGGVYADQGQNHFDEQDEYEQLNSNRLLVSQGPSDKLDSFVERMDSRLNQLQQEQYLNDDSIESSIEQQYEPHEADPNSRIEDSLHEQETAPPPPPKSHYSSTLRAQKSAFELGRERLNRTSTTKSSVTTASSTAQSTSTNGSGNTQATSQSLMSGHSAGGFSATSAGSLARRKFGRSGSIKERPLSMLENHRTGASISGVSYHSSHRSQNSALEDSGAVFDSFAGQPEKKRGFFKKILDTAKTSAANARSNIHSGSSSRPSSRASNIFGEGVSSIAGPAVGSQAAKDMGLAGNGEWVQMRRDVNRSNSFSRIERSDRIERCEMMDIPVLRPVEVFSETVQGDESADGYPVSEPLNFASANLTLVDKSARFVSSLPAMTNAISLAQGYLCRPYRSDVQRLRAIFTWVSERIAWEDDFEGEIDTRRVIQTKRGCSEEIAYLVAEMCSAIGIQAEIVRGYLKTPSDALVMQDLNETAAHPNHWWNTVLADGEWRIMDCSLANPSNPKRSVYSSAGSQVAESWWFLTRPTEICYTHVPLLPEQQHIVPQLSHEVLMALPVTSPPYFKNGLQAWDFDTSLLHLDGLEMAQIQLIVPGNVECTADIESRTFATDADGDCFESGDIVKKRALAQAEFICQSNSTGSPGQPLKRYTIKAVLPAMTSSEASVASTGTLNIYAGKRGLMHSINNNPHQLALSLPLHHQGVNPEYEFFTRHPTPHALRHELYVTGPLCKRLVLNSTFVFGVRQHPASPSSANQESNISRRPGSPNPSSYVIGRPTSAMSNGRPGSAMSMQSISVTGSNYSSSSGGGSEQGSDSYKSQKPTKLAIQSPSGKILRMTRKVEPAAHTANRRSQVAKEEDDGVVRAGSSWETIIKIGEKGLWRGLVLADRSARWCVFGEWECL